MSDGVKRVKFKDGMHSLIRSLMENRDFRGDVFRDEWDTHIVDTMRAMDTEKWETAVQRGRGENASHMIVVEQYPDRKAAEAGHARWVEALHADPTMELKELYMWEGGYYE